MAYGILKVDNITFDNGGSDQNVTVSGLYRATTSGVTVSGTIVANTVSGVTVIGSTTVSGTTVAGITANFTSGNFDDVTIADKIIHAGDTNTAIRFPAADTVSVETSGSERVRVDSSGRLLIGTNTSRLSQAGPFAYSAQLQVEGSGDDVVGSAFSRFSDDAFPTGLSLQKARGTKALPVIVNNNDLTKAMSSKLFLKV
jgi:hypothetical protein